MNGHLKPFATSWKTTSAAIATLATMIIGAIALLTDGDPDTQPDWNLIVPMIFLVIQGLFSRDADKSTEEHKE